MTVDNLSVDQIVLNCTSSGALPQQRNARERQQVQIRASWSTEHTHTHMHADTGDGPGSHFSRVQRWLHRKLQPLTRDPELLLGRHIRIPGVSKGFWCPEISATIFQAPALGRALDFGHQKYFPYSWSGANTHTLPQKRTDKRVHDSHSCRL